jgi:ABC-type Fe3+-siderophore transport system permease subunit
MLKETNKNAISEPSSYSICQKANEESWKLRYDTYKHLTTLSTGSILLLVTFLEKLFVRPIWKGLVIASFCLFLINILASLIVMNFMGAFIREMDIEKKDENKSLIFVGIALATFLSGVISLIIFAVINLYIYKNT